MQCQACWNSYTFVYSAVLLKVLRVFLHLYSNQLSEEILKYAPNYTTGLLSITKLLHVYLNAFLYISTCVPYLRFDWSIDLLMSFRESFRDLNSNEFRSPPSAKHCNQKKTCRYYYKQTTRTAFFGPCIQFEIAKSLCHIIKIKTAT